MTEDIERERTEALSRLQTAWSTGRLDAGEHERRTTALRHASTIEQIADAERGFFGATSPTPGTGIAPIPPVSPIEERTTTSGAEVVRYDPNAGGLSPRTSEALQNAAPFVAMVGFFGSGFAFEGWPWAWLWWMLIPLAYTVLPGFTARPPGYADEDDED